MSFSKKILCAAWNQDYGCFACGFENGFRIFNSDPLKERQKVEFTDGGIGIIEMLYRCNYIALVGGGQRPKFSPNRVVIWDDLKRETIIELDFPSPVRAVRLRRDRIVVVLDSVIRLFTFTQQPKELHSFETIYNPRGVCALSPGSTNSLLAVPSRSRVGSVDLIDLADADRAPVVIAAHNSSLRTLSFNSVGSLLASASEKGTLIRLFDTKTGACCQEVRRGTHPATVFSIAFSPDSSLFCVASDRGTVHVFETEQIPKETSDNEPQSQVASSPPNTSNNRLAQLRNKIAGSAGAKHSFLKLPVQPQTGGVCLAAFGAASDAIVVISTDGSYARFRLQFPSKRQTTSSGSLQSWESAGVTANRDLYAHFLDLREQSYGSGI